MTSSNTNTSFFIKKKKVPICTTRLYQIVWTSPLTNLLLLEHSVVPFERVFFFLLVYENAWKSSDFLGLKKFTSLSDVQKVVQVSVCLLHPKHVNGWGGTLVKCVFSDWAGI